MWCMYLWWNERISECTHYYEHNSFHIWSAMLSDAESIGFEVNWIAKWTFGIDYLSSVSSSTWSHAADFHFEGTQLLKKHLMWIILLWSDHYCYHVLQPFTLERTELLNEHVILIIYLQCCLQCSHVLETFTLKELSC